MKWIIQFVLKQLAKRSAKKTGITTLTQAADPSVRANVRNIEKTLQNMGVDINTLKSTDEVLSHLNIHESLLKQKTKTFTSQLMKDMDVPKKGTTITDESGRIWDFGEKDRPFPGWKPKVVSKETEAEVLARIKKQNKEAIERLKAKKKLDEEPDDLASGGIARVGMFKGKLAKWLLSLGKKKKPKIKKDRAATADELEDYIETLDPTGETGVVEEGMTIRQLDKMVADDKAYERYMYNQYKMGKLDPTAGDKSPARKRFLEKKLEDMELSGDKRLMTREEIEELSSFDLGTEMDEAVKKYKQKDIQQKRELEAFDVTDRTKQAAGGIAGQLHLNRPGYDNGGTTQIADKETNPYEYDTLEYWEWYLDKSMSRDPRYMGYWGTAHINDLIKRYEEAGGDALKYKTLFNKQLEKHTEHFESRTPEAQQKWLEREKEEFKKNYDRGIIPGQPKDEKSTPIIKTPYEQEIAQGGRVSYTKGGLAQILGV